MAETSPSGQTARRNARLWGSTDYRAGRAVASTFANVVRLPEWMQSDALGRDLSPLGDLAIEGLRENGYRVTRRRWWHR